MKKNIIIVLVFTIFYLNLQSQIKVACIGNSITYGYGIEDREKNCYPVQLQNLLGFEYEVNNFGVSARTMLKNGNLPYWNEPQYKDAIEWEPDIVIIKLGTNDAKLKLNWNDHKKEFIDDYKDMIRSFKKLPSHPEVYICRVVPAMQEIWDISDKTIKEEINPQIKQVSLEEGVGFIDLYTPFINRADLFIEDGIHPNSFGAYEMAKIVYEYLKRDKYSIKIFDSVLIAPTASEYQWYKDGQAISDKKGGNDKILKVHVSGTYKAILKPEEDNETRILSKEVKITRE